MASALREAMKGLFSSRAVADIESLFARNIPVFTLTADLTGANALAEIPVWLAEGAGAIRRVYWVQEDNTATNASDTLTMSLSKRPATGYGSATVAATHHTDSTGGTAITAWTPWELETQTAAELAFVDGDVYTFLISKAASGATAHRGRLIIEYTLEDS